MTLRCLPLSLCLLPRILKRIIGARIFLRWMEINRYGAEPFHPPSLAENLSGLLLPAEGERHSKCCIFPRLQHEGGRGTQLPVAWKSGKRHGLPYKEGNMQTAVETPRSRRASQAQILTSGPATGEAPVGVKPGEGKQRVQEVGEVLNASRRSSNAGQTAAATAAPCPPKEAKGAWAFGRTRAQLSGGSRDNPGRKKRLRKEKGTNTFRHEHVRPRRNRERRLFSLSLPTQPVSFVFYESTVGKI